MFHRRKEQPPPKRPTLQEKNQRPHPNNKDQPPKLRKKCRRRNRRVPRDQRWDCELEELAQNWADRCQYGHSTYEYRKNAGENIYKWSKSDAYDSIDTNTLRATGMWWDEIEKINLSSNNEYTMSNYILGIAGHWSQQAWGPTTKLGCGIANCTEGSWYSTHVVCHYFVA
uniref:SCP domain-containing protein n=1 Tax=Parascaris univalens TaxID=6257 RepID=A0A915BW61_PARUN